MVPIPARPEVRQTFNTEAELQRCIRDLVSLSSLPAIWIKADPAQIAKSLAQLVVSILDAELACVMVREHDLEIVHCQETLAVRPIEIPPIVRKRYRPNSQFEIDEGLHAGSRAVCVPIGRGPGSGLVALSRRAGFPTQTERMLLQLAANQAATAIQRWESEALRTEQAELLQRLNEVEKALYSFTDRLFRAQSQADMYEASLDTVLCVLGCTRASILMFDHHDVLRFVAWRGLSDGYREKVEGHSPWKRTDRTAAAICIEDIEKTDAVSEELKAVVRAEGIASLAFVPIFEGDKLAGKFMAYYDKPHGFAPKEIDAGNNIARQLGFALERLNAQEIPERLATIVNTSDDAIISKDLDGRILTWNSGAERIYGYTAQEVIGKPVTILMPPDRVDEEPGILARLKQGQRIDHYETVRCRKDGSRIDVSLSVSPIRNKEGVVIGASKIARDITERKRAEAAKELLLHEIKHRVKNTLSTVQGMAMQTLRLGPKEEREAFSARLRSLAEAHDLLTQHDWQPGDMAEVVTRALRPFQGGGVRIHASGPSVPVGPSSALLLSMLLHELGTNAVKYGALSNMTGVIDLEWSLESPRRVRLTWRETGGPPVQPPTRKGFGSRLIEYSLKAQDGDVQMNYAPEGFNCSLKLGI